VFSIPFWRHFIAWLGGVPATPGNFKKVLKKGSVAVIVGGIAEMYMQVRGTHSVLPASLACNYK
jgi:2-acylglycerol O-acyltransferase 2